MPGRGEGGAFGRYFVQTLMMSYDYWPQIG
jgi:hypothetical protein